MTLTELCNKTGLSDEKLADQLSISVGTLNEYKKQNNIPDELHTSINAVVYLNHTIIMNNIKKHNEEQNQHLEDFYNTKFKLQEYLK